MEKFMRVVKAASLALPVTLAAGGMAFAGQDVPGADWMPKEKVMQKLDAAGYTNVTGLHADDGYWEGKGVKNGQITEFKVDPHSGAFTKEKVDND
jgi:hypothetical protein